MHQEEAEHIEELSRGKGTGVLLMGLETYTEWDTIIDAKVFL